MSAIPPSIDPASIGNILVDMDLLTDSELVDLVKRFDDDRQQSNMLGKYIVRNSKITDDQLKHALKLQKKMKSNGRNALQQVIDISSRSHRRAMNAMDEVADLAQTVIAKANGG